MHLIERNTKVENEMYFDKGEPRHIYFRNLNWFQVDVLDIHIVSTPTPFRKAYIRRDKIRPKESARLGIGKFRPSKFWFPYSSNKIPSSSLLLFLSQITRYPSFSTSPLIYSQTTLILSSSAQQTYQISTTNSLNTNRYWQLTDL